MDKGIGFNRNIKLDWLDAAAAFCTETEDTAEVKARLRLVLAPEINSPTNLRKTVAMLLNIWRPGPVEPLRQQAQHFFAHLETTSGRLWLHYGLTLLTYPFFAGAMTVIGQVGRYGQPVTAAQVRRRLMAEMGQLGSITEALQRITYSSQDWGILCPEAKSGTYRPVLRAFTTASPKLESWLLACALQAQPAEEVPFADLINLPALFPFQFTVTVNDLRQRPGFDVQRQGMGLEMVRAAGPFLPEVRNHALPPILGER